MPELLDLGATTFPATLGASDLELGLEPDVRRRVREVVFRRGGGPNLCEAPRYATVYPVRGTARSDDLRGTFVGELTVQDGLRFVGVEVSFDEGFGLGADWAGRALHDPDCSEGPADVWMTVDDGNINTGMDLPLAWPEGRLVVWARDGECRKKVVVESTYFEP